MQDYNKPRTWNGKALKGLWEVTYKIDGVRALWCATSGGWRSRNDKPLYNIPAPRYGDPHDCEVFLGSLRDTVRGVRTQHLKADTPVVNREHLFGLWPLDARLKHTDVASIQDPSIDLINALRKEANEDGYEGLVLRQGDKSIKIKPFETHDVLVTAVFEGEGKYVGMLGGVITPLGDVGSGFTDAERRTYWGAGDSPSVLIGSTVEVECMQFTPDGKFRHAVFVRERFDKDAANAA